jgi:hypothetical protein
MGQRVDSRQEQYRPGGAPAQRRVIPMTGRAVQPEAPARQAEGVQPPEAVRPRRERAACLVRARARQLVPEGQAGQAPRRVGLRPTPATSPGAPAEPVLKLEIPMSPDPASRPRRRADPSLVRRPAVRSQLERPAPAVAWSAVPRSKPRLRDEPAGSRPPEG